ncbi:MAG: tetratricopeptide repeat protein [Caulobacterales bacterium]|nr:tetratricopeptide repeat protein [Caulobacterales bacterium]
MRKILLGATLLCSGLCFVNSAIAFPFAKKSEKKDVSAVKPLRSNMTPKIASPGEEENSEIDAQKVKSKSSQKDDAVEVEPPATKEERMAAKNLDIVSRARFWVTEFVKNQKDEEACLEASSALEQIGSYDRAIEIAATGIQVNEKNMLLWRNLGMSLLKSGQASAAIGAFTKASLLAPNDANLKNYLAISYDNLGNFDMAYKTYGEARKLSPNDPNFPTNQGFSLLMAGDFKGAEAILSEAIKMPNPPIQARQNLALAIGLQGRLKESEKIASEDLPPALAQKNIAYLREMLDGSQDRWKLDKQSALKGTN